MSGNFSFHLETALHEFNATVRGCDTQLMKGTKASKTLLTHLLNSHINNTLQGQLTNVCCTAKTF